MCATTDGQGQVVTDSDIERTVLELRAVDHKSAWQRTLEIGRLVLDGLFHGDEAGWRSRLSTKDLSLRRLVQHPACPFKKTALSDAVGVHLFVKRNTPKIDFGALSPTHVLQVLRLPNDPALLLLTAVVRNGWSVRELNANVRALRQQSGDRRGRPPSPAARKAETLARQSGRLLRAMIVQLEHCDELDESERALLVAALDQISELVSAARDGALSVRKTTLVVPKVATTPNGDASCSREAS